MSYRPEWEKCQDFVAGGAMRWQELSEGKTSDQMVDVLLAEISGASGPDSGGAEYFEGQVRERTWLVIIVDDHRRAVLPIEVLIYFSYLLLVNTSSDVS